MPWSYTSNDFTRNPTPRPSRAHYVPPPYRASTSFAISDDSTSTGNRFSGSRPRGRGRAGPATRRFPHHDEYFNRDSRSPFEEAEASGNVPNGDAINFDAYESVPVEASGQNVPPPVDGFDESELEDGLKRNIERCKYVKPTPVQRHAIPIAVAGRDLMACAQTGSGKTAAFCFPIISGILKGRNGSGEFSSMSRSRAVIAYPSALILSPTRELSCQIRDEAVKFAYQTGVKVVVAYGGASITQQLRSLERDVDILVATPGRLVDIIERERVSLSKIKYLALDEADRMLDMGFEHQIRRIVEEMGMPPAGVRQTLLFSATFPTDIQKLASDFLSDYVFLSVGRVGSSTELIAQRFELVEDMDKRSHLLDLLKRQHAHGVSGKNALTLVFVETKKGADALESWLLRNGFAATAIHGDKVQMERERALRSFKNGSTPVLVATDVASRGLDIPHVSHVVNFDLPRDIDDYVHRIGRTGRAGKSGLATAFFSDKNMPLAKALVELLQEANQDVPSWLGKYAESSSFGGGGRGRGRGGRFGRGNYGGRDFRNADHGVNPYGSEDYGVNCYGYGNVDYAANSYGVPDNAVNSCSKADHAMDSNWNGDHVVDSNWNSDQAVNSYTDNTYEVPNSSNDTSFEMPNSALASSYPETDANSYFHGVGIDGPSGYESVVATGWD
ncbi:hypothetical protein RJT34_32556 [Clitoria ternatea]|uniref:RNA helicase n=1 Tax=Clitoria ternatea TaxID=43366 RepID=A0AAN9EWP6_CLITE